MTPLSEEQTELEESNGDEELLELLNMKSFQPFSEQMAADDICVFRGGRFSLAAVTPHICSQRQRVSKLMGLQYMSQHVCVEAQYERTPVHQSSTSLSFSTHLVHLPPDVSLISVLHHHRQRSPQRKLYLFASEGDGM